MTQREQYGFQQQPCVVDPRPRTPGEAQLLSRLADAATETAREFGIELDRKSALSRARENLNWARTEIAKGVER